MPFLSFLLQMSLSQFNEYHTIHMLTLLLGISLATQLASVVCRLCHLLVYQNNGKGLRWRHSWVPMDFLAQLLQQSSELVVAFILIALAAGWTLSTSFSMSRFLYSKGGMLSIFVSSTVSTVLQLLGRRYDDDFAQFHDHEHFPGKCLIALRLLLATVFCLSLAKSLGLFPSLFSPSSSSSTASSSTTAKSPLATSSAASSLMIGGGMANPPIPIPSTSSSSSSSSSSTGMPSVAAIASSLSLSSSSLGALKEDSSLRPYVLRIAVLGLVWFLAFPLTGLVAPLLHPASRHAFVTVITLIAQCIALCFLTYSFLNPSSGIYKASSIRNMGTVFSSSPTFFKSAMD